MRILFFLLLSLSSFGQDYASIAREAARQTDIELFGKELPATDIRISAKTWKIVAAEQGIKPGDRVILEGPERGATEFHNLKGTMENPIVITVLDKVLFKRGADGGRVIHLFNCDYVRLTGTDKWLIEITGGGHGVTAATGSNHIEVDHVYIHHVGYSGIDITNYPTCDKKTWRGSAPDMEASVHDNRITDLTDGEGIYIGASHYDRTFDINCSGVITKALEPGTSNVKVYNNVIERVGADGIQVGGAVGGAHIHHNEVNDSGKKRVFNQASGIQANPGSVAIIEDNVINGCTSFGIIHQGRTAGSAIRRNIVKGTVGALFTVAREASDKGTFQVYNNTFIDILPSPDGYAVEAYSNTDLSSNILNLTKGTLLRTYNAAVISEKIANVKVVGGSASLNLDANYTPMSGSPAYREPVDAGAVQSIKPPKVVKEAGTVELITTDGIQEWFLITPSGKRKKIE